MNDDKADKPAKKRLTLDPRILECLTEEELEQQVRGGHFQRQPLPGGVGPCGNSFV